MNVKKMPLRTCVITKEKLLKSELIRVVKNNEGNIFVDTTGKQNGHGVYLKKDLSVVEKARKSKTLERLLESQINDDVYEELIKIIEEEN